MASGCTMQFIECLRTGTHNLKIDLRGRGRGAVCAVLVSTPQKGSCRSSAIGQYKNVIKKCNKGAERGAGATPLCGLRFNVWSVLAEFGE